MLVRDAASAPSTSRSGSFLGEEVPPQLDSAIADIANLGGPVRRCHHRRAVPRALRRRDAWAHLDIAGTMQTEKDDSWRTAGGDRLRREDPARDGSGVRRERRNDQYDLRGR
jgi:leucyl aminopeptidase